MKRKFEEDTFVYNKTRSKKPLLSPLYNPPPRKFFWVSGTDVRNYILKDPLVDWLELMENKNTKIKSNNEPFSSYIIQKGINFENKIVEYMKNNNIPIISVSNKITNKTCQDVIKLMKAGIPIIHSAPFKNGRKHIKGIIDFLVRSDFLYVFTGENPLPENLRKFRAPNMNDNYHYIVVDVKFSTLPLRADGIHLLNSGNYPAYKSQLWIYTEGIGEIQGYTSRYAYILGRRYKYISKGEIFNSINCLDKLGEIDYENIDYEYIEKTTKAIDWLKDLRKNGKSWKINPPSRIELYPNMCVNSGIWNKNKQEIAENIGEITQLWYCGVKNREKGLENGITSWKDPRCNSTCIGINGTRAKIIDKIISINQQENDKIRPKIIKTNLHNWRKGCNEMFVDFETFTDIFASLDDIPFQPKTDKIFMIGVWYKNKYINFIANKATDEEEYRIMNDFVQFVKKENNPKLWYWHAEKILWNKSENKQLSQERLNNIIENWDILNWVDLCQVFREEPIVIKGCFKFGLKEIAKAMRKQGLITTQIESNCHSGMDASIIAWQTYQENENPATDPRIIDIAKYNEFDVKVLWEIVTYLRNKH